MSYYINQSITYTAIAGTSGMPTNAFTYAWAFDDSTTGNTNTLSKAWTTVGAHSATVTATDNTTGGTATASKTISVVQFTPSWVKSGNIPSSGTMDVYGMAFGSGLYIALLYDKSTGYTSLSTSTDLIGWTAPTAPFASNCMRDIAYGNGMFVIIGDGPDYTSTTGQVNYSVDGVTWHQSNSSVAPTNSWSKLIFGGGAFIATSDNGVFMRSTDAISWSTVSVPARLWDTVTYGSNGFIALAQLGGSTGQILQSTDGTIWVSHDMATYDYWLFAAFGNGLYVATNGNSSISSSDGVSWGVPTIGAYSTVAFGAGNFVTTVSSAGYDSSYSADAAQWAYVVAWPSTMNAHASIAGCRFIGGYFMVPSYDTSNNLVCFAYT